MTDKNIINFRKVGGDFFKLLSDRNCDTKLDYYTNQFNLDDYYIYKCTRKQRRVSIKDFYEFKYGGYILFKKDLYCNQEIDDWIEYVQKSFSGFIYLNKPFPPKSIREKIKIIK